LKALPRPLLPIYLDVLPSDTAALLVFHALGLNPHASVVAADICDLLNACVVRRRSMRHRVHCERQRSGWVTKRSAR